MSFLVANTQDGFGEHRDKKYPMCTMKYTAVFGVILDEGMVSDLVSGVL